MDAVYGSPDSRHVEVSINACNRNPAVEVEENDREVRLHVTVDDSGATVDDCMGGADAILARPLGDRTVIANGHTVLVTPFEEP